MIFQDCPSNNQTSILQFLKSQGEHILNLQSWEPEIHTQHEIDFAIVYNILLYVSTKIIRLPIIGQNLILIRSTLFIIGYLES